MDKRVRVRVRDKRSDPSDGFPQGGIEGSSSGNDLRETGSCREGPSELSTGTHI